MALLNGVYIFVKTESPVSEIETVAHPVETGINVTDHVRRKPKEITLEGEVVGENAEDIVKQIIDINQKGAVVTYVGVNYFKDGQIINFEREYTNQIWGGCSFTMTIREVRFAKNSYNASAASVNEDSPAAKAAATNRPTGETTRAGVQQRSYNSTSETVTHTVKNGETDYTISKQYRDTNLGDVKEKHEDLEIGTKVDVGAHSGR